VSLLGSGKSCGLIQADRAGALSSCQLPNRVLAFAHKVEEAGRRASHMGAKALPEGRTRTAGKRKILGHLGHPCCVTSASNPTFHNKRIQCPGGSHNAFR